MSNEQLGDSNKSNEDEIREEDKHFGEFNRKEYGNKKNAKSM